MKKVFQAGPRPVSVNTSATNVYAFKVMVGGKKIICAANDWTARLSRMPRADAEWVAANSYHLRISCPMYLEELPVRPSHAPGVSARDS